MNNLPERTCIICKSEFYSKSQKQVYCSYDCYSQAARNRSKDFYSKLKAMKLPISKICPICHEHFETMKRRILYCSLDCSHASHKEACREYSQKLRDSWRDEHPKATRRECDLCNIEYDYKTNPGKFCVECKPLARTMAHGQGPLYMPSLYKDLKAGETLAPLNAQVQETFECFICNEKTAPSKDTPCVKCNT